MVKLEYRAIADGTKQHDKVFSKNQLIYEELFDYSLQDATIYFESMLGVTPSGACKCSPIAKKKTPSHGYFTFPENSEYGLNDCKEVVKGGTYTVNADSFKTGVLIPKPVKAVVEKAVKEK